MRFPLTSSLLMMMQLRRRWTCAGLGGLLLGVVACGGSASLSPAGVAGTWRQATLNGDPLPATFGEGINEAQLIDRTITLGESGSLRDSMTILRNDPVGEPMQQIIVLEGVYHLRLHSIFIDYVDSTDRLGRITGDRLVIDASGNNVSLVSVLIRDP
jgi:hypothetical protein